jgi:hypothetical protein
MFPTPAWEPRAVIGRTSPSPAPATLAERLADVARRLQKLAPDRRDPERYFVEKSELLHDLRQIAATPDATAPAPGRAVRVTRP